MTGNSDRRDDEDITEPRQRRQDDPNINNNILTGINVYITIVINNKTQRHSDIFSLDTFLSEWTYSPDISPPGNTPPFYVV